MDNLDWLTKRHVLRLVEDQKKLFKFMKLPHPYRRPKTQWKRETDKEKILSLADLHAPYFNKIVLRHVLRGELNAETLIIPGDIGDYYSKSRFRKTRYQKFSDELRSVFKLIELLANNFKTVKIMIGNHDNRPEKYIAGKLDDGGVDLLIMTESNMLDRLCAYFDNVEIVGTQLDKTDFNLTHIYQHGDIIFTHGELSLKQNSGILDRVENYLDEWGEHLQLKPFNVIAQAHNHRASKEDGRRTRMLLPTASNPYSIGFEYIYGSKMIGKPPTVGYSLFYQSHGITDINASKNIKFEVRDGKTQSLRSRIV